MTMSTTSVPIAYSNVKLSKKTKGSDMAKKPTGFKNIQASIAKKEGVSKKTAGAILASATRKASSAAKAKNPNLKKVK